MNTTTELAIRRATPTDREEVIAALTKGFSANPINCWIFDNPVTYHRYASDYFACYTDYCLEHGYVFTAGNGTGASLAMPFAAWKQFKDDMEFDLKLKRACGPHFGRASAMNQVMAEYHPTSPNHIYSAFTGVVQDHRSRGLGIQLASALLDLADHLHLPIYTEAGTEGIAWLCTQLGFSRFGQPLRLPNCSLMLYPLWRPPLRV